MYTVRRSLHYAFPYYNLVLGFGFLILGAIAYGIWFNANAIYEEVEPGVFFAYNIPESYNIIASYTLVGIALLIMFPRQYVLDIIRERRRFNAEFTRLPVNKATVYVVGGTAIAVVGILGIRYVGEAIGRPTANAIQIFIFIFTILYYFGIYVILPRHMNDIIDYLNDEVPDTRVKSEADFGRGDSLLFGRFKGADIEFSLARPNFVFDGRKNRVLSKDRNFRLRCLIKNLNGGPSKNFKIADRKERWFVVRGKDLDDCFNKRFQVTGGNTMKLSDAFKETLLNYPRHVNITLQNTSIQYDAAYVAHSPYRTREGMILLWVDLMEWHKVSRV